MPGKSKVIYLCGLMDGLSLSQSRKWREEATKFLKKYNILTSDPTKKVDDKFLKSKQPLMAFDYEDFEDTAKGIIDKDIRAIRKCDVLLCNLLFPRGLVAEKGPMGSLMELFFAYHNLHIPTIVVANPIIARRPWVAGHTTKLCHSLEEALKYIVKCKHRL